MAEEKPRKVHLFQDNTGRKFKNGGEGSMANTLCRSNSNPAKMSISDNPDEVTCKSCLREMGRAQSTAQRSLTVRVTAMPADTNPYGGVFGGWLMSQMALGAGSLASREGQGKAVVVSATDFAFPGAMQVGDELSVYCEIATTGNTSLTINAEAIARERNGEAETKVAQGTFKFVLLDENDRPRAVAERWA